MVPPPNIEVSKQIKRILSSEEFASTSRLSSLLNYIVKETLAGKTDQLQAYPIALSVFDRTPDFDPQSNAIVRVQAGQLRLRLDRYYSNEGKNDPILISVEKGAYVPEFSYRESISTSSNNNFLTREQEQFASITVKPFTNLTGAGDFDFFCQGLTVDVIAALTGFPDIRVLAVSQKDIPVDQSKNRFVLEGSVRKRGDQIRVSTQLIDTNNGSYLWTETLDNRLDAPGVFDLENTVATRVAAAIAGPSGKIAKNGYLESRTKSENNISAYDAVLQAFHYIHNPERDLHAELVVRLENAVSEYPDYSNAAAMLARLYLDQVRFSYNSQSGPEETLQMALDMARSALVSAPENPMAWHCLCQIQFELRDIEQFLFAGEKSISLSPNLPDVLCEYGHHLWAIGQERRGLEMVNQAFSLIPQAPGWYNYALVHDHFHKGRYAEALEKALVLDTEDLFWMHLLLASIYAQLDELKLAKTSLEKMIILNPAFSKLTRASAKLWAFPHGFSDKICDGLALAGLEID